MKKLNLIFVFVFLFGMVFICFQNISILEEEVKHKIELSKKSKTATEGGSEDEDPDTEDDFISLYTSFTVKDLTIDLSFLRRLAEPYSSLTNSITTPPPRI